MATTGMLYLETIDDLKAAPVGPTNVLVLGKAASGDGLGGFYRWDAASTAAEEMTYLNVVASSVSTTGRWLRVFQRVRTFPHGVLVSNGGVRTFYAFGTTDATGLATVQLTEDGTAAGVALFAEIWHVTGYAQADAPTANDVIIGSRASLVANLKTLGYRFSRGNSQGLTVLGLTVLGFRTAPTGTAVVVKVEGI